MSSLSFKNLSTILRTTNEINEEKKSKQQIFLTLVSKASPPFQSCIPFLQKKKYLVRHGVVIIKHCILPERKERRAALWKVESIKYFNFLFVRTIFFHFCRPECVYLLSWQTSRAKSSTKFHKSNLLEGLSDPCPKCQSSETKNNLKHRDYSVWLSGKSATFGKKVTI